ncbi:MAG: adenylate/guanylate cyclase domain-containing protein [Rhodospirillaceae bacterium]|nr:adenylate/guanylate cyclase domain-containing protein [Rhodospirillaceae bacterium]
MPVQTHYEVHVQQGGRWSIHAQFDSHQKDVAIEEAKQLDSQGNTGAVKVIREVYDSGQGTHRNYVIYKSAGASASDGETDRTGTKNDQSSWSSGDDDDDDDGGFGGDFDDDDDDDFELAEVKKRKKKKTKKVSLTGILVKLLLITLFSICLAALTTVVASNVLGGSTLFGYRITAAREANMLFVVFTLTFLIAAGSMAMTFMRGDSLGKQKRRRPPARRAQAAAAPALVKNTKRKRKESRDALGSAMSGSDEYQLAEAEKQKAYMMDFLSEALKKSGTDDKKMDNFNKFGVNLFLAGACETLADKRDLDAKSRSKVLADSVRVMGFKKSHASTFADKYEEYLLQDPRYMQMYQAGRNAMNTHFQDPDDSAQHMKSALAEWNQPKKKEEHSGPITVLFTDIAGSTAMPQKLGDAGAQEVVRIHNRIVRAVLTNCNGREVKHTGDGIMASFGRVTDSIDASIQMQEECMVSNQQNPDLPLHLKIGINAGEPIVEDNDLFGTVVQLSARIVDKAQADEIFVSEIVRGICTGKNYKFDSKGGYEMKGFDGPMTLYEVVWRNPGAAAAE